jgi:hypothetical protein
VNSKHSRQKRLIITSAHGNFEKLKRAYHRLVTFFNELKTIAPQLTTDECWNRILAKAMEKFRVKTGAGSQTVLQTST